ncbi:hypothetical protein COCNU_14G007070 [Cocos nucifera]|uniref:Uncharacterized protein n=1 Tax=Cocos nucifera TaxID=13894 RepID=A0A8K0IWN3_COCNU|nr:hypothetical protein COCNU_14G007070 [Cocos nucifera]
MKATFDNWKVVYCVVEESLLPIELKKMEELSFLNQQRETFSSILKFNHCVIVFMNAIKATREYEGVLEKVEARKVKAEANGASEKKRRKAVEAKVTKVEKEAEGRVAKVGCLAVEAFQALPKFFKIKIVFDREAFVARHEECRQKIVVHHPEWNLSFLDDKEDVDDLSVMAKAPLMEGRPSGSVAECTTTLKVSDILAMVLDIDFEECGCLVKRLFLEVNLSLLKISSSEQGQVDIAPLGMLEAKDIEST